VLSQPGLRGDQYQAALSPYLDRWQADVSNYVPRLLRFATAQRRLPVIVFIDNVDQLAPIYQAQVFLLAQRVARTVGSITVLALREESYYTATLQKTLTAYTSRKFHIASPNFRRMIDHRIRFSLDMLENSKGPIDYVLRSGITIDRTGIAEFLKIIETSIFQKNRNIARFIEALCFGNMRLALSMFSTFMTSGATDVDKMLNIYRRSGSYYVAFHEFVKSIMLSERRYYKDSASPILNLFDCGAERDSSHFSSLRIMRVLQLRRGESTNEGQGYVDIGQLVAMSEDVFDDRENLVRALNRLVVRQLVEVNTRSTDSIAGASHVRITSSGWYYCRYLVSSFSYIDLVLQDTPLNDSDTEKVLRSFVQQVDNLSDREEEKLARLEVRFARVRAFLAYLRSEEEDEATLYELRRSGGVWATPFMPDIISQIEREIEWIERRLKENREIFPEDIKVWSDESELDVPSGGSGEDEAEDTADE
jgi:SpoVK/Ycf46/Vps4 family AAA+-type ATPase